MMKIINKKYRGIKIAVDFDGTLNKHLYPKIGEELPLALETILWLQSEGCKIYLDTMRSGKELQEAIDWCSDRDLEFDSIGPHPSQRYWSRSSKCHADLSIDDRAVGTPLLIDETTGRPYIDWEKLIPILEDRLELLKN